MSLAIDPLGKKIFVGIDVHKRTYSVTCLADGHLVHQSTTKANPSELAASLKNRFKGAEIRTTYEAGFSGFVLHRHLAAVGILNIVVNPASIEKASNSFVKTDKIDSNKLAKQLSIDNLKAIYVPTEEEEQSRQLNRTRAQLVEDRVAVGNRIKSKLALSGFFTAENDEKMSNVLLKKIEKMPLPPYLKLAISSLIETWRFLQKQIYLFDRAIKKYNLEQGKLNEVIRSVPGVGPISANTLLTELGDMSRFKNERSLFSFTGLTPHFYPHLLSSKV